MSINRIQPYFQIAMNYLPDDGWEEAELILASAVAQLEHSGLDVEVSRLPARDGMVVWNVHTPGLNQQNEKAWMRKITRLCKDRGCAYRFRFPYLFNGNPYG